MSPTHPSTADNGPEPVGRPTIKSVPEDFVVEEVPAIQPEGAGEHLWLWIEKRDLSSERLMQVISGALGVGIDEIGLAGMKDRRAVTRQWVSVPARCEPRLARFEHESVTVLATSRHSRKLRRAQLRGNRFSIRVRHVPESLFPQIQARAGRIAAEGFPNRFGTQRFGARGETPQVGFDLLAGRLEPRDLSPARRRFLLRLGLSAAQSQMFNEALRQRELAGTSRRVLAGDVLQLQPGRRLMLAHDPQVQQPLVDAGEATITGPIFGAKMVRPEGQPRQLEERILEQFGVTWSDWERFRRVAPGTRRPYIAVPRELVAFREDDGLRVEFFLPSGCYATVLLEVLLRCRPVVAGGEAASS